MVFNTSYTNKEYLLKRNALLEKPFGLLDRLRLKGIGSNRFTIYRISSTMKVSQENTTDMQYANIALYPKGIVVHFNVALTRYSWIIPYYQLVLYQTETFGVYSSGKHLLFKKDQNYHANKKFITKMIDLKNKLIVNHAEGY